MKVTLDQIERFTPCFGWDELYKFLGPDFPKDRKFSVTKIAKTNSVFDTFEILHEIMEPEALKKLAVEFSCECAERVLPVFEARFPENDVPRKAISAARAWLADPTEDNRLAAKASRSAVKDFFWEADQDESCDWEAAREAARDAGYAADAAYDGSWKSAELIAIWEERWQRNILIKLREAQCIET